jgi:hypothetical protein
MAARFTHLTTREDSRLARREARTAWRRSPAALDPRCHHPPGDLDPAIAAGTTPLQQAA